MNNRSGRRVVALLFVLLCFFLVMTQAAADQEKPVTSEKLSIEDATAHVNKKVKASSMAQGYTLDAEIIGIRNREGVATIYYRVFSQSNGPEWPQNMMKTL